MFINMNAHTYYIFKLQSNLKNEYTIRIIKKFKCIELVMLNLYTEYYKYNYKNADNFKPEFRVLDSNNYSYTLLKIFTNYTDAKLYIDYYQHNNAGCLNDIQDLNMLY